MNHPKVAIVGSGPSGCYAAQFIHKYWQNAEINIFEALPVPYGLARYGIAADHQGNKAITKQFDRLFERANVNFIGNVNIGTDINLDQLKNNFDYVIQATGLFYDKKVNIAIDAKACVVGAGHLLRLINSCPLYSYPQFNNQYNHVGQEIAIIGAGNVALDVARLLSKKTEELQGSDVDDDFIQQIRPYPIHTIHILSRSDLSQAKFDLSMFKELLHLSDVKIVLDAMSEPKHEIVQLVTTHTLEKQETGKTKIIFHFNHTPLSINKIDEKTQLQTLNSLTNSHVDFKVDTVITAIGFEGQQNKHHQKDAELIQVGWFKRGSVGTVADNRKDTKKIIDDLIQNFEQQPTIFKKLGLSAIKDALPKNIVSFNDWKSIEAYERITASNQRCRKKVSNVQQMLNVIEKSRQSSSQPMPLNTFA